MPNRHTQAAARSVSSPPLRAYATERAKHAQALTIIDLYTI